MTPGNELRTARERLSLSREEISRRTKIQLQKIEALEEDGFDRLPAGIYLDGIAAAYAREVGLDVHTIVRRLRAHVAPPPPETLESIAAARESTAQEPEMRLSVGRSMLAFAAFAVALAIAGMGVRLYPGAFGAPTQRDVATRSLPREEPAPRAAIGAQSPEPRGTSGSEPDAKAAAPPPPVIPAEAPPVIPAEAPLVTPAKATQQSLAAASTPRKSKPIARRRGLTGVWTLETEVESSSLKAFKGLRLGYHLDLRQNGDRIEGIGQKVTENGVALTGARRTPITVRGTLDDGRMRLTFGEQGARRRTTGTFDLVVDEQGALRGVFASEAARSAGAVAGRRL